VLGDRYGERTVILAAVGATAVASLLIAVSPSILAFIVFAVVLGAGAGLHYSVATTFLAKSSSTTSAAPSASTSPRPNRGLAAPPLAALVVGSRYGWRAGIALGVAVAVPVFALFAWRVRPTEPLRPDQPVRERFALGPLAELLSRPEILYTTALSTMGAFTWQATASFLPSFLEFGTELSAGVSALLFSLYFLVHGATQPVTGSMSDRIGRDATVMATMAAGVVGYGLLVAAAEFDFGRPITVVGVGFVGLAMSWGAPLQSRFMDLLSDAERGAGFGLVRTAYMVVGVGKRRRRRGLRRRRLVGRVRAARWRDGARAGRAARANDCCGSGISGLSPVYKTESVNEENPTTAGRLRGFPVLRRVEHVVLGAIKHLVAGLVVNDGDVVRLDPGGDQVLSGLLLGDELLFGELLKLRVHVVGQIQLEGGHTHSFRPDAFKHSLAGDHRLRAEVAPLSPDTGNRRSDAVPIDLDLAPSTVSGYLRLVTATVFKPAEQFGSS